MTDYFETGATPDVAGQESGVELPAAEGNEGAVDLDAEFEEAIKGKYAEPYKRRTESIVTGRVKNLKARNSEYGDLARLVAERYGADPNDLKAIKDAFENDRSYLQAQADDAGVTVEVQAQLNQLKSAKAREQRDSLRQQMAAQVEEATQLYPELDLDAEMADPEFMNLIGAGISVKDAYTTRHLGDIMGGAIQYAVNRTQQKTLNDIRARGTRPLENGASSQATASAKIDVNKLTPAQMDELEARALRGEIIEL